MEIQLSEDLIRFIETQVTGQLPSHQDVVETALRRMRDQEPMPPRPGIPLAEGENDRVKIAVQPPNESALTILQAVRKRREDRPASDSTAVQDTYARPAQERCTAMAMMPASQPSSVTIDANVLIALCAKEVDKYDIADAELTHARAGSSILCRTSSLPSACMSCARNARITLFHPLNMRRRCRTLAHIWE